MVRGQFADINGDKFRTVREPSLKRRLSAKMVVRGAKFFLQMVCGPSVNSPQTTWFAVSTHLKNINLYHRLFVHFLSFYNTLISIPTYWFLVPSNRVTLILWDDFDSHYLTECFDLWRIQELSLIHISEPTRPY